MEYRVLQERYYLEETKLFIWSNIYKLAITEKITKNIYY